MPIWKWRTRLYLTTIVELCTDMAVEDAYRTTRQGCTVKKKKPKCHPFVEIELSW